MYNVHVWAILVVMFRFFAFISTIQCRYYTISQIPRLCVLDDTPITEEERKASGKIFGPQRKKTRKHQVGILNLFVINQL